MEEENNNEEENEKKEKKLKKFQNIKSFKMVLLNFASNRTLERKMAQGGNCTVGCSRFGQQVLQKYQNNGRSGGRII